MLIWLFLLQFSVLLMLTLERSNPIWLSIKLFSKPLIKGICLTWSSSLNNKHLHTHISDYISFRSPLNRHGDLPNSIRNIFVDKKKPKKHKTASFTWKRNPQIMEALFIKKRKGQYTVTSSMNKATMGWPYFEIKTFLYL